MVNFSKLLKTPAFYLAVGLILLFWNLAFTPFIPALAFMPPLLTGLGAVAAVISGILTLKRMF